MKKMMVVMGLIWGMLVGGAQAQDCGARPEYVKGRVIVKLRPGVSRAMIRASYHAKKVKGLGADTELWRVEDALDTKVRAKTDPSIVSVDLDTLYYPDFVPNDPCYVGHNIACQGAETAGCVPGQWNLDNIQAPLSWDVLTQYYAPNPVPTVLVGTVGSGMQYNHPDLINTVWTNPGEVAGDGIDNDNDGYVDDVHGIDLWHHDGDPLAEVNTHETLIASVIAATTDNGIGSAGVNPFAKVVACRTSGQCGGGASASDLIECVDYFMAKGVKVINTSFGCGPSALCYNQTVKDKIDAYGVWGGVWVASAGNSAKNHDEASNGCTNCRYPCDYTSTNLVCVASNSAPATGEVLSSFSDYGVTSVDIAAPGGNGAIYVCAGNSWVATIWGALFDDRFAPPVDFFNGNQSGTSFSAPTVAAAAAGIFMLHPNWSPGSVKTRLLFGVDVLPPFQGKVAWNGRLNLKKTYCGGLNPLPAACAP